MLLHNGRMQDEIIEGVFCNTVIQAPFKKGQRHGTREREKRDVAIRIKERLGANPATQSRGRCDAHAKMGDSVLINRVVPVQRSYGIREVG